MKDIKAGNMSNKGVPEDLKAGTRIVQSLYWPAIQYVQVRNAEGMTAGSMCRNRMQKMMIDNMCRRGV